jgi:hypothetical protein
MGSQNCRIVGKSQPVLMMINPMISTRIRMVMYVCHVVVLATRHSSSAPAGWGWARRQSARRLGGGTLSTPLSSRLRGTAWIVIGRGARWCFHDRALRFPEFSTSPWSWWCHWIVVHSIWSQPAGLWCTRHVLLLTRGRVVCSRTAGRLSHWAVCPSRWHQKLHPAELPGATPCGSCLMVRRPIQRVGSKVGLLGRLLGSMLGAWAAV